MKKISTLALLAALAVIVHAQTTFYNASFTGSIGTWTTVDNTGNSAGVWQYKTNPVAIPSGGTLTFASATASGGYMLFMSDAVTNDGKPENSDLISPAINCSSLAYAFLQFDEVFLQVNNSMCTVSVSSDGTNWNEVYTNNVSTDNPNRKLIDISQYAAGQTTVYLKFNYQGNWEYFWGVDDIKIIVPPALDASVDAITMNQFISPGNQTVTGTITNRGGDILQSLDLSYTINGGTAVTQNFSSLGVLPLGSTTFSFVAPAALTDYQTYTINVTASNPNGGTDAVSSNNSASMDISALSAIPHKNVLDEEYTTAQCQYCPMGSKVLENVAEDHNYVIPVALHAGFGTDGMTQNTLTAATTIVTYYYSGNANGGAPAVMIDRVYWDDHQAVPEGLYANADFSVNSWDEKTVERYGAKVPVSIIADNTYNSSTRQLTVNASAKFYTQINNLNYRINCYIVEDSVSGSGGAYDQVNYYNNHDNGAYNPWYGKGNPIVGYQHRHVARYMFGGAWGTTGVIPATANNGDVFTKQYTYTLPAGWNDSRIKLVVLVQDYNNTNLKKRNIINALQLDLNSADSIPTSPLSGIMETAASPVSGIEIYPNPTSGILNIDYSLTKNSDIGFEVYDIIGQKIHSTAPANVGKGNYTTRINTSAYNNGIYFVAVKDGNKVIQTLKFIVSK